jgi:hypothetical protein
MLKDKEGDILKMGIWVGNASSPTIKRVWKRIRADYMESTKTVRPKRARQQRKVAICSDYKCRFRDKCKVKHSTKPCYRYMDGRKRPTIA